MSVQINDLVGKTIVSFYWRDQQLMIKLDNGVEIYADPLTCPGIEVSFFKEGKYYYNNIEDNT
jgi:hypothetical protein